MIRYNGILVTTVGLIIVSQIAVLHAANSVPVLIWGRSGNSRPEPTGVNPFKKTSPAEFIDIIKSWVGPSSSPVVGFVENNLCMEDLTQHKEQLQRLTKGLSFQYIPAIEKPLSVLENFDSYNQTEDDDIDSMSEGQIVIKSITNFDTITEVYESLKEANPNVVGVLTGKSCSLTRSERTKRETTDESSHFIVLTERVLLYSNPGPTLKVSDDTVQFTQADLKSNSSSGTGTKDSPLILHLEFQKSEKISIKFVFLIETDGYYTLKHVAYSNESNEDIILNTDRDIVFPFTFSYHCTQNVVFEDDKKTVQFSLKNMQVQIDAKTFGDAYDCVGFTTIPIWTGIFVTAILALIMIWALTMLIDIRSMDRFDDPKGKTITISAQE